MIEVSIRELKPAQRAMRCAGFAFACALVAVGSARTLIAQDLPTRLPTHAAGDADPKKPALAAADTAETARDHEAATRHLLAALWFDPFDATLLGRLARIEPDPDRSVLWALAAAEAGADEKGAAQATAEWKGALARVPALVDVVATRRRAGEELAQLAKSLAAKPLKSDGGPLLTRFLRDVGHDVLWPQPALWPTAGAELNASAALDPGSFDFVIGALRSQLSTALAAHRPGDAIRIARCLHGIATQAAFKDLKGPKPPALDQLKSSAAAALSQAREWLKAAQGEPLTIDQLRDMEETESLAFTRDHANPGSPGVAVSPTGKYRLETICGHATLLGAARTVEMHHDRLVSWYGKDPFVGKQGIVRIVPEASDLEAEGTPFWWAGGFQSGPITVLRFSAGTITGLGRGLTHELTHRFDGELFPGIPAWMMEGRAVWTGAAYGAMTDTSFIANHISLGTCEEAMRKGYGGVDKLKQLIDGTIDDYRDNYTAGYALWVYLASWEADGRPLFAPELQRFMSGAGGKKALSWFDTCFCDGRGGRPKDLAGFAKGFDQFLAGSYWLSRADWTKRYVEGATTSDDDAGQVFDVPTWGFARNRSEPFFGQDQWGRAGDLLLELGRRPEATAAFAHGFLVDEWHTPRALDLAKLLDDQRCPGVEFVLRNESRLRSPERALPDAGKAPFLNASSRTVALLGALDRAATQASSGGLPLTAAALAGDRDRVAARLGLPPSEVAAQVASKSLATAAPPFAGIPHSALALGLEEVELSDYDEHRVPGLWFEGGAGDVHVGREKPRDQTGELDRNASMRHAFVRAREWLPAGRYRLTTRVHFTTTYVSGAFVIGYTRRDRNVRFSFNSGDYLYSIGVTEQRGEEQTVAWNLSGLRDGEGAAAVTPSGDVKLVGSSFQLELLVDGAQLVAWIDGKLAGSYHTVDGQPIEGYLGFAASFGAWRADHTTIERLDRARALGVLDDRCRGFDLAPGGPTSRLGLENRRVSGIPLDPAGTVVLFLPPPHEYATQVQSDLDQAADNIVNSALANTPIVVGQLDGENLKSRLVLLLPEVLGDERLATIRRELPAEVKARCTVLTHAKRVISGENADDTELGKAQLFFVDSTGVLRKMSTFTHQPMRLPDGLKTWIELYRGRGRPAAPR